LREAEIVVGGHVQGLGGCARQFEAQVEVIALPIQEGDETARNAGDRPSEAIIDPHLQSSYVEIVKIAIQRSISILLPQMPVMLRFEALSEKIPDVAEDDKDEIGNVGGD